MIVEAIIIKGAIALIKGSVIAAKAGAAKAAVAKAAAPLASKAVAYVQAHGVMASATATAQTTLQTCALAGMISMPVSMASGYKNMLEGILNGDKKQFIKGLLKAKALGTDFDTLTDVWNDFEHVINSASELDIDGKKAVFSAGNELFELAKAEIEGTISDELYDCVESFLSKRGVTTSEYISKVKSIYLKKFDLDRRYTKNDAIAVAGELYHELFELNLIVGLWNDPITFDHSLVYMVSGWMVENLNLRFDTNQKELSEITGSAIIKWIDGEN